MGFAKLPRGTGHAEERLKARPGQETIVRAFDELLESVRVQKCRVNEGYLKALGLKADVAALGRRVATANQNASMRQTRRKDQDFWVVRPGCQTARICEP